MRLSRGIPLELLAVVAVALDSWMLLKGRLFAAPERSRRDDPEAEVGCMRRRVVALTFAGLAALASGHAAAAPSADDASGTSATVAVQRVSVPDLRLRDEAAMVLLGTALIGLAAAVRRAA